MRIQDPPREPHLPAPLPVHVASKAPFRYFEALLRALDPQGTRYEFRYSELHLDGCRYSFAWRFWTVWRSLRKLGSSILLLWLGSCIALFGVVEWRSLQRSGSAILLFVPGSCIAFFGWWHWRLQYRGSCTPSSHCRLCYVDQFFKCIIQILDRCLGIGNWMPSWCRTSAVYILYHTVTSGRLNLTDVADSLYDDYLKYLEARAGYKNVIIFVDDVLNREAAKQTVQSHQPTAEKCSGMIYYFKSKKEKDHENQNVQEINAVNDYLQNLC